MPRQTLAERDRFSKLVALNMAQSDPSRSEGFVDPSEERTWAHLGGLLIASLLVVAGLGVIFFAEFQFAAVG